MEITLIAFSQPQLPFLTNAAGKPVARVTPVTSVGADATPPKPKPPPLTPKPAPSEIVKRLSFKRDAAPEPSFKRDAAPEVSSFKRDPVADSSFKRDVAPDSSLKREAPLDSSFKREASPAVEEKRDVSARKAGVNDEKTTSNSINNNNENRRSMGEQVEETKVKPDPKVGGFLDEPPDKPPPEPPNTNQPNESTKVRKHPYTLIIKSTLIIVDASTTNPFTGLYCSSKLPTGVSVSGSSLGSRLAPSQLPL